MSDTGDFLEHYGVKGMKWGKRKGGSTTADRVLDYKKNKASNTSVARSLSSFDGVTGKDLIKAKGNLKAAVADRNSKNVARIERVQKGEGSVRDMMRTLGSVSIADVVMSESGATSRRDLVKKAANVAKTNKVYSVDNATNRFKKVAGKN